MFVSYNLFDLQSDEIIGDNQATSTVDCLGI